MGSPAGSTSGSSSGWEQIDVGDVTDAAHEVASFTNTQAAPHLLDQVATPHPEQTTSSDDDFLFVASHSSSPHEDAQSAASPLGDTASQTPPTVPEKSLPASSIDQAMTGAAAMTAGIAETSLESSALLADQQVAAISDEDAAAATSAPEHVQVPASFPVLGSKRAAPQAALRPLRTRYTPFTTSPSKDSSLLHQGLSDDLFNVSPTASRPVFNRSFGKSFGALVADVASSQQPLGELCRTVAGHTASSQQTAPQSPVGTAAYSPEGTAAWDLYAGTASATLSPPHSFPPLLIRWQQQQQQSRQEQESRLPMYQRSSGSGLMQLQQRQTLGGPPQQHLFDANPNSPRLRDYTQAQLWDHIQKMPGQPSTSPHQAAFQEQRLQAGLQPVNSPHMQQQQGGPSRGYTQQDCSRDFQQWDPFRVPGHSQQQEVQAKGTEQGKSAAVNADAAQACSKEFQQWDPFLNHPGPQQQQQQQQGDPPQSCTQEQDLQSLREQNAALRSQQWQLQQECNALKQREGQSRSLPKPVQLGQKQYILEFQTQQVQDRYNLQAESLAKQQAQKHERYASTVGSLQNPVVDFEPEQQDQYSMLAENAARLRAQRLGRYARHQAALQSPGAANTGRAAAAEEEEEALQAAMEASAKEYREQNNLLVGEEIVLPIHGVDRLVDGMQRRTAESLPIRHDHGVVWQNEEPISNSIPAGSNTLGFTTASAEVASPLVRPTVWPGTARVGKLRSAETLHRFATRHMCDVAATAAINGLQLPPADGDTYAPPVLYPGQILQLPESNSIIEVGEAARLGAQVAEVESGCIEQFAKQRGVQLNSLLAVNGLPLGTCPVVRCGQVLQLP